MSTKVLIVEDDALIALGMTDVLSFAGFEIIGPVSRVSEALRLAEVARPSVAVVETRRSRTQLTPSSGPGRVAASPGSFQASAHLVLPAALALPFCQTQDPRWASHGDWCGRSPDRRRLALAASER